MKVGGGDYTGDVHTYFALDYASNTCNLRTLNPVFTRDTIAQGCWYRYVRVRRNTLDSCICSEGGETTEAMYV